MLSVALCTYHGEKYIGAQLNSLALQSLLPDELVAADDSRDLETRKLLEGFAEQASFPVRILPAASAPRGIVRNFSLAVEQCEGDYIALCDQDDIWMSHKLAVSMECMKGMERRLGKETPILIHSDLMTVDGEGHPLSSSMMKSQGIANEEDMAEALKVLLVQNYVTGCTVLMNQSLKQLACPFPDKIVMHDWWLALLAASCGYIGYVAEPTIGYRQHGDNNVGAKRYFSLQSVCKAFRFRKNRDMILRVTDQARELKKRLDEHHIESEFLREYLLALEQGDVRKIHNMGIRKQGRIRNFMYYVYLWFGNDR